MEPRLNTGLGELSEAECVRLLDTQQVGRLGVIADGRPEIFPMNYTLEGDRGLLLRTVAGTKLRSAVSQQVVFEVDRIDPDLRRGWSVVVHGVALHTSRVTPGQRGPASWLPDRPYMLRISHGSITGRYLGARPEELDQPA